MWGGIFDALLGGGAGAACGAGVALVRLGAAVVDRCAANCTLPAVITDVVACACFRSAGIEEVVTLY